MDVRRTGHEGWQGACSATLLGEHTEAWLHGYDGVPLVGIGKAKAVSDEMEAEVDDAAIGDPLEPNRWIELTAIIQITKGSLKTANMLSGEHLSLADEDNPGRPDAYRLERIDDDGIVVTLAVFHSVAEARTLINHLGQRYRLMFGDKQFLPDEPSSGCHDDDAR
ncbi:hypothetical protein [Mesorhizobium sp. M0217]|uniref:hypothetical protein n=1 Tax=unclassified Mesorhizobium TaxID=325217 RepID=UPI00333D3428